MTRNLKSINNKRQPKWDREEVVFLVVEYFKTKTMSINDRDKTIENISKVLRNRAKKMNLEVDERYRNISGIKMKFGNLKSLDPEVTNQGFVGLYSSSKLDREILNEYLKDPQKLISEADVVSKKYEGLEDEMIQNKNQCGFISELKKLKESSKEAIEGIEEFSSFKEYIHISRKVEEEFLNQITETKKNGDVKKLHLICGSVGDGKSHIISQLKHKHADLLEEYVVHNDATESDNPTKNYKEVLDSLLEPFSDAYMDENQPYKLIIAINLGTLNNFIEEDRFKSKYSQLRAFVKSNKIIEDEIVDEYKHDKIYYVNFSDYSLFHLRSEGVASTFIEDLFERITSTDLNNPFYDRYQNCCIENCSYQKYCPLKNNYDLLSQKTIQSSIIQLLIEAMIKYKIIISVRSLMDFIYSILVPLEFENYVDKKRLNEIEGHFFNENEYWRLLLPNILFEHKNRNTIFNALHYLDPLNDRTEAIDDFLVDINTTEDKHSIFTSKFNDNEFAIINQMMKDLYTDKIRDTNINYLVKTYIRSARLFNDPIIAKRKIYNAFIDELYNYNNGDISKMINLYDLVIDSIYKWNGRAEKNWINIDDQAISNEFTVSQELKIEPDVEIVEKEIQQSKIYKFENNIKVKLKHTTSASGIEFIIDYDLFELLVKVNCGYKLNSKDKENYIAFIDSFNSLLSQGEKNKNVKILHKSGKRKNAYYLKKETLGGYTFESSN